MTAPRRFIFCDIDGTLLHARSSGRSAFGAAFAEVFGIPIDMSHINFAGATDIRVLEQLMQEQQLPDNADKMDAFFKRLPHFLDQNMTAVPPTVFPGVETFLSRVSGSWNLGLVTGNIKACAYMKLKHAGLASYFSEIGGFGDDHGDRNRMAELALERAGRPQQVFLLGDTPSDIEAARVNGIVSVAVCNGQFDRTALEAEEPDIILDSFEDAGELFKALDL